MSDLPIRVRGEPIAGVASRTGGDFDPATFLARVVERVREVLETAEPDGFIRVYVTYDLPPEPPPERPDRV